MTRVQGADLIVTVDGVRLRWEWSADRNPDDVLPKIERRFTGSQCEVKVTAGSRQELASIVKTVTGWYEL